MNLKKNACFLRDGNQHLIKYVLSFMFFCSAIVVQGQTMSILASDATGEETSSGAPDNITFSVVKSAGGLLPSYDVAYTITIGAGNATNGDDYVTLSGVVTVPGGGSMQADIVVDIVDDVLVEGPEDVTITLDTPAQGAGYFVDFLANSATGTIVDNDSGTVFFSDTDTQYDGVASETPTDTGRFRLRLTEVNNTPNNIIVFIAISGTATLTEDYATQNLTILTPTTASIPFLPGQRLRNINIIDIIDDDLVEGDETVELTITGTSEPTLFLPGSPLSSVVTIEDNDCSAGDAAPELNDNPTAFCDDFTVQLDSYFSEARPPGAFLIWTLNPDDPLNQADWAPRENDSPVSVPGLYYAFFWDEPSNCASPITELELTQSFTPVIGTTRSTASCNTSDNGGITTLDLDTTLNGSDSGGIWTYVSGPGGPLNPDGDGIVDFNNRQDGDYMFQYELVATAPCVNQTLEVIISVTDCDPCIAGNQAPTLDIDMPTVFCDVIDVNLSDYSDSQAPPGTTFTWSTDGSDLTNTNAHLNDLQVDQGGTYYGFYYDATNDCASPALVVQLTQNTTPTITDSSGDTRCGEGPVTLTATATGNATFNWYTTETGSVIVGTGESFTIEVLQTTTYYLEATENGCATSRVPVIATVQIQPFPGTPDTSPSSCNDPTFGDTTLDLDDLLTDEDAGVWVFTSGPLEVPRTNDNIVDFNGQQEGTYVYTFTTSDAQAPCIDESVSVSISVSSCDTDEDGDGLLGGLEAALGTDPNNADSDSDGIDDNTEVGSDTANPLDEDEDGIIDALDSNLLDTDEDGVVDQLDPANNNACIPDINNILCDEPIDLEVLKVIDNPNAVIGDEVTFTVTVNNLGPRAAQTIVIGDFLESGFEYQSHIPSLGTYDQNTGEWQLIEELASGAGATLSITVTIVADENGMYSNTAELLSSDPLDSNPANDSSTVTLGVEQPEGVTLAIEKTARLGPDTRRLQELTGLINDVENTLTVEYFIKVTNESETGVASNFSVRDVFETDADITYEIMDGPNVPDGSSFNTLTGIWNISGNLGVGEEIELSYVVVFEGTGIVVNTAQIISPQSSDQENINTSSSVTLEITNRNGLEIGILYNQFSPNADGINDILKVNRLRKNDLGLDELVNISYNIEIFNRYGSLVYEAMNITQEQAWDGTWKGKQVPEGTYFYALNVTIEGETEMKTSKGWIQLIR